MAAQSILLSPQEYLLRERSAAVRHEYVSGVVYAMAGATFEHVEIVSNLSALVLADLRSGQCRFWTESLKVWIEQAQCYHYPDGVIACPANVIDRELGMIDNPIVLFEVLSESTALLDEGAKFAAYRTLSSLREYVLIDSRRVSVRICRRADDETWSMDEYGSLEAQPVLHSVPVVLPVAALYRDIGFG